MRFLEDIIKEQQALLKKANRAINKLTRENNFLKTCNAELKLRATEQSRECVRIPVYDPSDPRIWRNSVSAEQYERMLKTAPQKFAKVVDEELAKLSALKRSSLCEALRA